VDSTDTDVADTARREAFEEIGLQASNIKIWGRLGVFPGKVSSTIMVFKTNIFVNCFMHVFHSCQHFRYIFSK